MFPFVRELYEYLYGRNSVLRSMTDVIYRLMYRILHNYVQLLYIVFYILYLYCNIYYIIHYIQFNKENFLPATLIKS